MNDTRQCPYCAETIRADARLCRYCRSRLGGLDPERWHRDHPERRVAGVAVAVARALAFPTGAVRLGFIVLTFFHLLGPLLYGALWLLIPFAPGGEPPLGRLLGRLREIAAAFTGSAQTRASTDGRTERAAPADVPQGPRP